MPLTAPTITVENVSFSYGSVAALERVSFTVESGEYVAVVGPNGGGKSTLFKLLLGLLQPNEGSIQIGGMSPQSAREKGIIGYVPQRATEQAASFPATVEEVVRSGAAMRPRGVRQEAAREAMEHTGIFSLRNRRIGNLSGGQLQRTLIARALASNTTVLLLDEPVTGVDAPSREQFYSLLASLNIERRITVLFSSHDVDTVIRQAQSLLCINKSICTHTPKEYVQKHFIERMYAGDIPHAT